MRANPGQLRVAYAGRGTLQHVAIELFQHMAGVRRSMAAYPGSAAALDDLLRGAADAMSDPVPSSMPHVRAGRLIPIAKTDPARAAALPELPTVAETLPGYEDGSWALMSLGVPRQTPGDVAARLNHAVHEGLKGSGIRRALNTPGAEAMLGSAAAFASFIAAESARYADIITRTGIRRG